MAWSAAPGTSLPRSRSHDLLRRISALSSDSSMRATRRLQACLPRRAASWGLARKLLNIFVRDSLYTSYLAKKYGLIAMERFLEIPLDSITSKRIRKKAPELPRWLGVKHLSPDTSAAYQAVALLIAKRRHMARVHLDASWWGSRD